VRRAHHVTVSSEIALSTMRDAVALWYVNYGSAADIIRAAGDLLVAGADGPSLCMLAAVPIGHADEQAPELLEAALRDVGLAYCPPGTVAADEAGIRAMASRVLSGILTPRTLAEWAQATFSCHTIDLVSPLKRLGYAYDLIDDYPARAADQLDADVMAQVRSIVASDSTAPEV
jgi:hypothetical protein